MAKLLLIILVAFGSCARYEYDIVDGKKVKYYYTNKRFPTIPRGSCQGDGSVLLFHDSTGNVFEVKRDSLIKWFKFF